MLVQWQIFIAFFRSSLLGYGGGPAIIPLVYREAVERYEWINADEFADIVALGNTLPGPIYTKMAGYLGYRVGGILGMINALVAAILPSLVLMFIILSTLSRFQNLAWVAGMKKAILPAVGVMLMLLTWQFLQSAWKTMRYWVIGLHLLGWLALTVYFPVHPAIIFGLVLIAALFNPLDKNNSEYKAKGK